MRKGRSGLLAAGLAVAGSLTMSACSPSSAGGGGSTLRNLFLYGGTTVPPAMPAVPTEVDCPTVTIAEGGAALRSYAGGRTGAPDALRNQLSIVNLARECIAQANGSILVKVGVEGRALIGPAGSGGQFEAPVSFVIRRGDRVLASRARRATVAVTQGQLQASFVVVEDGLVVPPNTGEFDIEVALGGSAPAQRRTRR